MDNDNSEKFKKSISDFFNKTSQSAPSIPDLKPVEDLDKNHEDKAVEKALEELETVRQSFLEFQEHIVDLAIFPYLYDQLEEFATACTDFVDVIVDPFKDEDISEENKTMHASIQQFRTRILKSIMDQYNGG